jgi:ankyrin repeat protein
VSSPCLPSNPNVDHLKGQARTLQRRVRAGDEEAIGLVRRFHPRADGVDRAGFRWADAQLVVARGYGFASWTALRRHLAVVEMYGRSPHEVPLAVDEAAAPDAHRLLRLGCLVYGGDDLGRHAEARALLAARPELSGTDVWTAAAAGDVSALAAFLASDATLAIREGGPFAWVPLLYVAYSRLDAGDPVAVARLLLDHGADPNAGYLWEGNYPFTALTGVLGGGEDKGNQPPHRAGMALARLLLEAGADPNDSQALYNRQFDPDDGHLRLLIEFGLGTDRGGPWHARLNSGHGTPAELLEDQLSVAASENRPEWARLALAAGADPDGRGTRHPIHRGLTPYALAVRRGNREVAEILLAAGATAPPLDPVDALLAACMAGDRSEVAALAAGRPAVVAEAVARRPEAVLEAAEVGRPDGVRLLVGLGFDVNFGGRLTPLHQAAYDGDVALVETLLELGADPSRRDASYQSTPLGWAEHARRQPVIEILRDVTG